MKFSELMDRESILLDRKRLADFNSGNSLSEKIDEIMVDFLYENIMDLDRVNIAWMRKFAEDLKEKYIFRGHGYLKIVKRNGEQTEFLKEKVVNAIIKAMNECETGSDEELAWDIAEEIENEFEDSDVLPTVESVSDRTEELLAKNGRFDASRRYILFRNERAKLRLGSIPEKYKFLTNDFLSKYKHKEDPFPTELGKFVYYRTYSRPIPEENRRERWWETVARVVDFSSNLELMAMKRQGLVVNDIEMNRLKQQAEKIYDMMYSLKLFPSGRSLWVGNTPSSYLYPLSNFNCSAVVIDSFKKFSEILFVLTLGTGAGLSVERKYVSKLPKINSNIDVIHKNYQPINKNNRNEHTELKVKNKSVLELVIGDSKFAWARAIELYFDIVSSKQYADIEFILMNYDHVRPAGERLKTFGGFASGHIAIQGMFEKIHNIFQTKKKENQLQWQTAKPIDCLDIATIIAEGIVSGGTRRSALIVFCDKDEKDVLVAKSNLYYQDDNGNWQSNNKILHRMLSNNTVFYYEKPSRQEFSEHFNIMKTSGEPAIANMQEMKRRREDAQLGNPCFEIILVDRGVCNLTEVNMMGFVNPDGTYDKEGLLEAQRLSGVLGYRMATIELELHEWNMVNTEDRLTGCSLTGVMDFVNATGMNNNELATLLRELRETAHESTNELADKLRLNRPKLATCVKPSGTISQLPTVSSGVHFSHSPYYIRRVRVSANDPLANAMSDVGFKWSPEVGQTIDNHKTKVFEFPVKAPEGKTKYDVSAIEQLELYKLIMKEYVDHNASNTIHITNGEDEWKKVEEWVYNNWDDVVGVTFLSLDDSFYQLMPYESITKNQYEEMLKNTPKFNPSILSQYENFEEEFDVLDSECDGGVGFCPVR